MSKTQHPIAAFKQNRKTKELAAKAMRRAAHIGVDPRDSHATQAAVYDQPFGLPATKVVNGRRVWDL